MRPVTVGIDARTFCYADSLARGIGHYSRYHLLAVAQQKADWNFICYSEWEDIPKTIENLALLPNVTFRLINEFHPDQVDIIHICDPMSLHIGFDSPLRIFKGVNKITVTFYDLIPLHLYFPSWSELQRTHFSLRLKQFVQSNATLLAISAFTGSDLIKETGISSERVKVIMAGLNASSADSRSNRLQDEDALKKFGISRPFFLHVGAHDPHKNFVGAYQAFVQCRQEHDVQFVVVGELSGELKANALYAAEQGLDDVVFTGFVSRQELEALYREAVCLLFLSRFEGFGFPVLEAMANGCPVITTNVTSIPEVAGDAALMFDPDNTLGITAAMQKLLCSPVMRQTLIEKGRRQAAQFTWEKTGEATLAVWQQMLLNNRTESQKARNCKSSCKSVSVLFDISVLGLAQHDPSSRTGVFRVVEHLAKGLAATPEVELHFCSTQHVSETAPHTMDGCRAYLAEQPDLSRVPFHERNYPPTDIFHSPFHPLPSDTNAAVRFQTVYDLIPVLFPDLFQGRYNPVPNILAGIMPGDHALCISHATKDDLCLVFGMDGASAHVTHLAADPAIFYPYTDLQRQLAVRQKYNFGDAPYILSLCTLEPRKNIDHLLRAFARLVREGAIGNIQLVLTGTKGWDFDRIFSEIDNNPELHKRIVLTGYVPDEELAPLYSGAQVFAYMSLYEGFGLPPLEAMQCGTPVITSNTSSLPEVVGDAGIMLDPHDQDGLCRALVQMTTDHEVRDDFARRASRRAALFSWERCVEETIAAYRRALAGTGPLSAQKTEQAIVIDGVIFQLQQGRPFGISRLWQSMLTELGQLPIGRRIILLDRAGTAPELPGIRKRTIGAYTIGTAQDEAAVLDGICAEEQAGLFLSTYYTFTNATPSLLMLYDMIPERFDTVGPEAPNPEWRDKCHAIMQATAFAAISASTARDLATWYPEAAMRPMALVPCAVSDLFRPHSAEELAAFRAASGITKPYFLLVGRRDQHKNVELFFQAFEKLPNRADYALVMAGTTQPLEPELREMAGDAEGYAGFFTDEALSLIYSGAVALVYPSRYEGFGLPILEAMQFGCPVITCQNSSLPEVAGSAALYVGENNVDEMLQALQAVQQPEVREYLVKRGQQRAAQFSWQGSAGRLVQLIDEVERTNV